MEEDFWRYDSILRDRRSRESFGLINHFLEHLEDESKTLGYYDVIMGKSDHFYNAVSLPNRTRKDICYLLAIEKKVYYNGSDVVHSIKCNQLECLKLFKSWCTIPDFLLKASKWGHEEILEYIHTERVNVSMLNEYRNTYVYDNVPQLEMLHKRGLELTEKMFTDAILFENIRVLEWLQQNSTLRPNKLLKVAIQNYKLYSLAWLLDNGYRDDDACYYAVTGNIYRDSVQLSSDMTPSERWLASQNLSTKECQKEIIRMLDLFIRQVLPRKGSSSN